MRARTAPLLHLFHLSGLMLQPPLYGSVQLSGKEASEFTQDDLENGRVTYVHTGPEASGGQVIEDDFKIKVTDGTHNRFYVYPDLDSSTRRSQKVSPVALISFAKVTIDLKFCRSY